MTFASTECDVREFRLSTNSDQIGRTWRTLHLSQQATFYSITSPARIIEVAASGQQVHERS
jgi:hypothetical protein